MPIFKKPRMKKNNVIMMAGISFLVIATIFTIVWSFHSAPPSKLTITAGPKGSMFERYAERYQEILKLHGVKLVILLSEGSVENLKRLNDKMFKVDIGFVQSGIVKNVDPEGLVALGSVSYEPLYLFYRNQRTMELISELKGKKLAIGEIGSGTHKLSLQLLSVNGIKPGEATQLLYLDSHEAANEMIKGSVDAVFLMGDSVSRDKIRLLLTTHDIRLFSFKQAEAYTRHSFSQAGTSEQQANYLHKLDLPMGAIDFGENIPPSDITLIGPSIELVARKNLHPALSDLLLEAATEVHYGAGMLKKRGEFPIFMEEDFTSSSDAKRFYKSGQSFLYRELPFWVASLINRILFVLLPLIVIFPSVIRGIPALYKWRIRLKVFGWYRELLDIEQKLVKARPEQRVMLLSELDHIEARVNKKVPTSFADQFYALRGYIHFVRGRVNAS